jgi:plasmid stabilization system protein ParE
LLVELDAVFDRIREAPDQFPLVEGTVRRALLHKFPYSVYYSAGVDCIDVVAVIHQRRYPATWKREPPPED